MKNLFKNQPTLYKYWLTFTFLMGIGLVWVIPPFQSPDEFNHFYRAYQIADGHFGCEFNADSSEIGGNIPLSLLKISRPFDSLESYPNNKVSLDTIVQYLKTPLERDIKVFEAFPNTARYAPTAYFPQAISIFILRLFNAPPLWMMYLGRLANFLFWWVIVGFAVAKTPYFKHFFMVLLLLPASLAINSTSNADVSTYALFFLIFGFFFQFREKKGEISNSELIKFATLIFITTLNKICYFPILFLLLFIEKEKFGSLKKKVTYIGFNGAINLALAVAWSQYVHTLVYPKSYNPSFTTYESLHLGFKVNPDLQTQFILQNPFVFLQNLIIKSSETVHNSYGSWIGSFGWESKLPSGLIDVMWYFLLIFVLFCDYKFKIWERVGLAMVAFGTTMLFLLSTHLHWDGVGDFIENGWHGKYYIPIFPLYFWALSGIFSNFVKDRKSILLGFKVFSILIFIAVYVDFAILIYDRYYKI